ncbi:MAG: ABC-ATPase UvrA [Bdellovibrionales bacterium]|nr:ABC-ATPase UvrA [Bdellovibrionales bacterium]NQZ18888.1 ABC-ATPase UvrA [Bdellovibrionales bacterium]
MNDKIDVKGAREHNLKNISVSIEKNKMTVITGLSGSGKSSLAFDTIYAEGQRRFIDSLSTYARNFLFQLNKPDVDDISGLCPSVAIDQKTVGHSPRSTVGTVTEIYDFLRLLYAKAGTPLCPTHKVPVEGQTMEQIQKDVLKNFKGEKLIILAPVARSKKGEFKKEIDSWIKAGYVSAKIDGKWVYLDSVKSLKKTLRHDIDIVIDKIILKDDEKSFLRLSQALSSSITLADGKVVIESKSKKVKNYSTVYACPICGYSYSDIDPLLFSFNNPKGACESCNGLGTQDVEEYEVNEYEAGAGTTTHTEWRLNSENPDFEWKDTETCESCGGSGLREEALNVYFKDHNIYDLASFSTKKLYEFFKNLDVDAEDEVLQQIIPEITSRLEYLNKVGAGYLSLARRTKTLSGGEAQRIRLASQVGTPLVGVLYVLDEPSIGLHPRDHHNVLEVLNEIKNRGNTIIVVEHDEETMEYADQIIDMGPGAGVHGGVVVAQGTPEEIKADPRSLTGQFLSGKRSIPIPRIRRPGNGNFLKIRGAHHNNLKHQDVDIPLGCFVDVSGVSGSGKSSLVIDTLHKYLSLQLHGSKGRVGKVESVEGLENIGKGINIDQSPIGRTPRSNPATYVDVFGHVRCVFVPLASIGPEQSVVIQVKRVGKTSTDPGAFTMNGAVVLRAEKDTARFLILF